MSRRVPRDLGLNRWYWFDGTHKRLVPAGAGDKLAWALDRPGVVTVWQEDRPVWTAKRGVLV